MARAARSKAAPTLPVAYVATSMPGRPAVTAFANRTPGIQATVVSNDHGVLHTDRAVLRHDRTPTLVLTLGLLAAFLAVVLGATVFAWQMSGRTPETALMLAFVTAVSACFSPLCLPLLPGLVARSVRSQADGNSWAASGWPAVGGLLAATLLLSLTIVAFGPQLGHEMSLIGVQPGHSALLVVGLVGAAAFVAGLGGIVRATFSGTRPAADEARRGLLSHGFLYGLAGLGIAAPLIATAYTNAAADLGTGAAAAILLASALVGPLALLGILALVRLPASLSAAPVTLRRLDVLVAALHLVGGFILLWAAYDAPSFRDALFPDRKG